MSPHVLVIGDSLAGLVAAWQLANADCKVTLLKTDQEKTMKGDQPGEPLIFWGPSAHTEGLWKELEPASKLTWNSLSLEFHTQPSKPLRFPQPCLPAPWHSIVGMLSFTPLPFRQRIRFLNYIEKIWEGAAQFPGALDLHTADSWLFQIQKDARSIQTIWNPLCRLLLGTDISKTKASHFANILKKVFFISRKDGLRISSMQLWDTMKNNLYRRLERDGVMVESAPHLEHIQGSHHHVSGIRFSDGTTCTADWYLAAIHPTELIPLIPERWLARYATFQQISHIPFTPVVTVNAIVSCPTLSPRVILHEGKFSWTLCRSTQTRNGPATLLSCVATSEADLLSQSDDQLTDMAWDSIQTFLPIQQWKTAGLIFQSKIQRQNKGFTPHMPGMDSPRPSNQSPIKNLFLAGSWTDTDVLTEIESELMSGETCARTVRQLSRRLESR